MYTSLRRDTGFPNLLTLCVPRTTMPPPINQPHASPRRSSRSSTLPTDSLPTDAQPPHSSTGRKKRKTPPTNRRDRGPPKRVALPQEASTSVLATLHEQPFLAEDRAHGIPFGASPPRLDGQFHGLGLGLEEIGEKQAPEPSRHVHTEGESTYTDVPLDLITGETPAVAPKPSGAGLHYVPLVRNSADRNSPDLIRVLIVHSGNVDDELECSIKIRLLPLLDTRGRAKKTLVQGIAESDLPKYMYVVFNSLRSLRKLC